MGYKHIFFDLDRTLWDFEQNSRDTLLQLVNDFNLIERGVDNANLFIKIYKKHNNRLWDLYRENKITKEELRGQRFLLTLQEYKIKDSSLAESIGLEYINQSPLKTALFPFTKETLTYLHKRYKLHIITNGFQEVQSIKLASCGLDKFFNSVITSEQVGVKKPNQKIFKYALNKTNALPEDSLMIGDDLEVDVIGAQNVGMKGVYFNPDRSSYHQEIFLEISSLNELMKIL